MNERIRELLDQSGLLDYTKIVVPEHEKFAELIVRECIDICDAYGMPDGTSPAAQIISLAIKHKFGVKD